MWEREQYDIVDTLRERGSSHEISCSHKKKRPVELQIIKKCEHKVSFLT